MARCVNCNTGIARGAYLCERCQKELGVSQVRRRPSGTVFSALEALLSLPFAAISWNTDTSQNKAEIDREVRVVEHQIRTLPDPILRDFMLEHPLKESRPQVWLKFAQLIIDEDPRTGPVIRIPKLLLLGPSLAAGLLLVAVLATLLVGIL